MNVHLTNCGMQPLPKLKRGRKSIAAADLSLKDGQTRGIKDHFLENKLDLPKKKRRHAKTTGSGTEIILASKRGRKPHFTNSISSEIAGQDCVVEQYDDGYVCETHGLKYGSRHTINVHLMHCGMEPLPKLKRGRKSSTTPSESKRRRYEPSRSQEIAIATGTDMNEKSYNRSSPSASGCVSPPERLDAGLDSMPCSNLCIQKVDDFKKRKDNDSTPSFYLLTPKLEEAEAVKGIEGVSGHLKVGIFICDRESTECKNSFSQPSSEKLTIRDCSYRWFDEFSISSHVHLPKAQSFSTP
ncbi:hypothetical protein O6H91_05G075600 [Diphasiastrum complanatum]|nr:hypothetical protein O6H91_05G075600 [Diphasiastrum complanatum]